jgi:hypothetical protein
MKQHLHCSFNQHVSSSFFNLISRLFFKLIPKIDFANLSLPYHRFFRYELNQ